MPPPSMCRYLEYREPCPDPLVLRSVAQFQLKPAEPAGRAYHERLHGKRTSAHRRLVTSKPSSSASSKPALKRNVDLGDYYGLLRVPVRAPVDNIRRSYREVSLLYHPDKNPDAEHVYKAIQEAHTTLTDSRRRRVYDSTLPFDDAIPPESSATSMSDAAFFATFGPVFERNAWFSEVQPAPLLGDARTPFADVDVFYDFWFGFRSWRDFSADCEHKPELAENRDERRWMEKENQKVTNAKVKAEAARIRKLVDRAFKADPRVKAQRALDKAERQARKRERAAQRHGAAPQKDVDDAERAREARQAAEAEASAAAALLAQAKKAAQDEKRLGRTLRKGLREAILSRFGEVLERNGWALDDLFAGLSVADLQEFTARVADTDAAVAVEHISLHARRVYQQ